MKILPWMLGGVVFVSTAFFIAGDAGHIWQSLLYAYLAAIVFLGIFIASQNGHPGKSKKYIAGTITVLLLMAGIHGWFGFNESQKQKQNLTNIRETIEVEIAKSHINEMLQQTLRTYYTADTDTKKNIGAIFYSRYDSLINNSQINYDPNHPDESLKIALAKASTDSLVLVAYSTLVAGERTEFENHNGSHGHLQTMGVLTAGGIEYERQN